MLWVYQTTTALFIYIWHIQNGAVTVSVWVSETNVFIKNQANAIGCLSIFYISFFFSLPALFFFALLIAHKNFAMPLSHVCSRYLFATEGSLSENTLQITIAVGNGEQMNFKLYILFVCVWCACFFCIIGAKMKDFLAANRQAANMALAMWNFNCAFVLRCLSGSN